DGIRDFHVTGVQTCALPIYPEHAEVRRRGRALDVDGPERPRGQDGVLTPPETVHHMVADRDPGVVARQHDPDGATLEWGVERVEIGRASCRESGEISGGAVS